MARLVVNPNSPTAWEIQLKPGNNFIGRGFANDFKLTDPSVSGSHCQVTVDNSRITIKDLGSTNGTFVNRAPVKEAVLQAGQTVHLGGVEMLFYSDAAAATATVAQAVPGPAAGATPPPIPTAAAPAGIRLAPAAAAAPRAVAIPAARPALATAAVAAPPPVAAAAMAAPAAAAPAMAPSGGRCRYHPKTAARYFCSKCSLFFCELCVTSRNLGGVQHKTCRQCGTECVPVQVQAAAYNPQQENFFSRLPGVFGYPFRGSGLFVMIIASIVFFALGFISAGLFSIFTKIIFYGYLFSFMQNIIHSTASEDNELPGFPPFDGLFGCFLRLAGAVVIAFGAPLVFGIMAIFSEDSNIGATFMIPAMVFGCIYFPMALLAVAMKDTPLAANPLIVLPAMFKVPLEYIVTVVVMGAILALESSGPLVIDQIFPRGLTTHSMAKMFGYLGAWSLWKFAEVYLLAVNMRILGLLYLTKKRKLAWFDH